MKGLFYCLILSSVFLIVGCSGPQVDKVVVHKSANKMYLIKNNKPIKEYDIALGGNPIGHKMQEGDMRTPEGQYLLDYKNDRSKFYKSINISYPNSHDIINAQLRGVSPGDDIVIHGLPNGMRDEDIKGELKPKNWTQGCIAVKNREMDEIWQLVEVDTPIEIRP